MCSSPNPMKHLMQYTVNGQITISCNFGSPQTKKTLKCCETWKYWRSSFLLELTEPKKEKATTWEFKYGEIKKEKGEKRMRMRKEKEWEFREGERTHLKFNQKGWRRRQILKSSFLGWKIMNKNEGTEIVKPFDDFHDSRRPESRWWSSAMVEQGQKNCNRISIKTATEPDSNCNGTQRW